MKTAENALRDSVTEIINRKCYHIFKLKTGRDSEKKSRPVCVFGAKERIEQCDLMQKNSADVSAICGKEGDYTGTAEYNAER